MSWLAACYNAPMNPLIPFLGSLLGSPDSGPQAPPPAPAVMLLRSIPQEAVRGEMRPPGAGVAEIGGKQLPMAPGLQIRDTQNRIILSDSVRQPLLVKYLTDSSGALFRVWVLTAEEAAAR